MTMADGRGQLQKIAFQVGNTWFRFAINPENYAHKKPHRTTAIKTKSRIVIEDFQSDIPTISIRGTTGFNPTGRVADRGINKIREMKSFLEEYAKMGGNGRTASEDFYFHNYTNGESFVVHLSPEGVSFTQDVNSPLTYKYDITFTVLRNAGEPSEDDIIDPEIGNRFPSIAVPDSNQYSPYPVDDWMYQEYAPLPEDNIHGDGSYRPHESAPNREPINPQEPSHMSYEQGVTGMGYYIGYYGRYGMV